MSPIKNQIKSLFIPVGDIESARDWYCDILALPATGEIIHGHLFIIPMNQHTQIVLDSKIYSSGNIFHTPLFHFNTDNIQESFNYLTAKKVEIIGEIQHGHWFNFKDPYGNVLMVCEC